MQPPRLLPTLAIWTSAFLGAALALACALIVMTTRLEQTSDELAAAVERVRVAQQSTIDLLLATRGADSTGSTYAELADLVDLTAQDARAARRRAEDWNRQADRIGLVAILVFVIISGALMWWLRRAAASLRARSDARATLLRSIAHDLRSPLSALRLSIEIIADRPQEPDAQIRRGLARVKRQLASFDRLISDLTDLAQVEDDELRLQLEICDVVAIVRDVVGLYESQAHDHPIVVTVAQPCVLVRGDPARLEQVVGNLLTNAVKYSPAGAPVSVVVETSDDGATIAVADRGPGIRPEDRDRLFQAYWRGTVGAVPGSGLGLFITRRIVEAHGGTIDVDARPEGGSVFRVRLPGAASG